MPSTLDTPPTADARKPVGSRKAVKGIVALAAAAVLLVGGYGTYALWSSTTTLDGGAVNSGQLKLVDPTPGVWTDVSAGAPGTVIPDIAAFNIVPGDTLTYSTSATVRAQGDNLAATLAADPTSVTGDPELLADVAVSTVVSIGGTTVAAITEDNDGDSVATVVTFAFSAASGNTTQLENLDLSNLKLTLTQNAR